MKMFQGMYNTFVVDTGCNEIGVPLHFFGSISHSHPYSGIFQHRNVISSPESHRLFAGNSEISQYFFHSDTLVSPNRHDIGKQRIPAGSLTFR